MVKTKSPKRQPKLKDPKAKKPKKPSVSENLAEAAELLGRIEAAEQECQEARGQVEIRRADLKSAKEHYSFTVDELRRLCRARREKLPLFDKPAASPSPASGAPTAKNGEVSPTLDEMAAPPKAASGDGNGKPKTVNIGDWRTCPVEGLQVHSIKVTDKQVESLCNAGLNTCGELADAMEKDATFWHRNVKGIGKDTKVPIEDALSRLREKAAAGEFQVVG